MADNEYQTPEHALAYLARAGGIPHRAEGEAVLLSFVPPGARRILDLGTGGGRLLALLHEQCPNAELVGLDFSPTMIAAASDRFSGDLRVSVANTTSMIRSRLARHTMQLCPALRFIIVPMSESAHFTPRYTTVSPLAVFSAIWNMLHRPRLGCTNGFCAVSASLPTTRTQATSFSMSPPSSIGCVTLGSLMLTVTGNGSSLL